MERCLPRGVSGSEEEGRRLRISRDALLNNTLGGGKRLKKDGLNGENGKREATGHYSPLIRKDFVVLPKVKKSEVASSFMLGEGKRGFGVVKTAFRGKGRGKIQRSVCQGRTEPTRKEGCLKKKMGREVLEGNPAKQDPPTSRDTGH